MALGVFRRIGDQLVDDKAERDGERGRYFDNRALDHDGVIGAFLEQQARKILAQVLEIFLELDLVLVIEKMQPTMHAPSAATRRAAVVN